MDFIAYLIAAQTWIMVIFGLMVGSFMNVCIYRIPEGTFWKKHRSHCRHCDAQIAWFDNIPVLSFLALGAKARCCKKPISWQYPAVELLSAILFVVVYWQFAFIQVYNGTWYIDQPELIRFCHALLFSCLMLICSVIDLRLMIIPDVISIPMILATPLVVWIHPELGWWDALLGVLIGGGGLAAIIWLYWLVRKEYGMGLGDVKLLAAIGGWLGYQAILPTMFIGSTLGAALGIAAIVVTRNMSLKSKIPFGPFLAFGAFVHLVFYGAIQEFLFRLG